MSKQKNIFEGCQERIEKLIEFSINANQYYIVIMMLRDIQKTHSEYIDISPTFYNSVFRSCMQSLFVDVSKMFDKGKDNESIYKLLKKVEKNLQQLESQPIEVNIFTHLDDNNATSIFFQSLDDMVTHYLKAIEASETDISSLKNLRNKYFAHLDITANKDLKKLFEENNVSLITMEKLLVLNMNTCNALCMYFCKSTMMPLLSRHNDLYNTICCLEKYDLLRKKYKDYS